MTQPDRTPRFSLSHAACAVNLRKSQLHYWETRGLIEPLTGLGITLREGPKSREWRLSRDAVRGLALMAAFARVAPGATIPGELPGFAVQAVLNWHMHFPRVTQLRVAFGPERVSLAWNAELMTQQPEGWDLLLTFDLVRIFDKADEVLDDIEHRDALFAMQIEQPA